MTDAHLKSLKEVKREYILKVLEESEWDLERASQLLKISSSLLRRHLREYGIKLPPRDKGKG
ncbi:MAG: hypothetical protein DRG31_05505 [Deltaproteobacteria bacterium]|nr:MAG: hypothetical protein DRG31_05505 [Deltaproteobacteria bacterium]